jgi:hypothetical protein
VETEPTPWDTGSMVASTATSSLGFAFGNMVFSYEDDEEGERRPAVKRAGGDTLRISARRAG